MLTEDQKRIEKLEKAIAYLEGTVDRLVLQVNELRLGGYDEYE